MANLKIKADGPTGQDVEVFVDGKKIDGLVGVSVDFSVENPNIAMLQFVPDQIEIETQAELIRLMENASKKLFERHGRHRYNPHRKPKKRKRKRK